MITCVNSAEAGDRLDMSINPENFDTSGKHVEIIDMSKDHGFMDTFPGHGQDVDIFEVAASSAQTFGIQVVL